MQKCVWETVSLTLGESQAWEVGMGNNAVKKWIQGFECQANDFRIFFL